MGYYTRSGALTGAKIQCFKPDDTKREFYLESSADLQQIIDQVKEKWGDIKLSEVTITSEYIHTDCLTYDRYDPLDWTNYIKVTSHKT